MKKAIYVHDKMRNSLAHRNSKFYVDDKGLLNIENRRSNFEIQIPIKILDEVSKGCIFDKQVDRIIFEKVSEIISPILKSLNYDILKIGSLFYNIHPNTIVTLLECVDNDINKLHKLDPYAFDYPFAAKKLSKKGLDITKLPFTAFENPTAVKEIYDFKLEGLDITKLPNFTFMCPIAVKEIHGFKLEGLDITKLPYSVFIYPEKIKKLSNSGLDITKLPYKVYAQSSPNPDNIKYLLKHVGNDYEKLKEFPIEFFEVDIFWLNTMLKRYYSNIYNGIFGTDNPKLISAYVYCNNVLSNYNRNLNINIDINEILKFIDKSMDETIEYVNNVQNFNSYGFVKQFLYDDKGKRLSGKDIILQMLDKLRNASAHLRFISVKDKNGKIVEDKVYIFDKENDFAPNNFDIIVDIKDLISIVRKVELALNPQIVQTNVNTSNNGVARTV